ncbi:FCS-Like Zinc finger 10 [Euphorbia lathyris]|uniref:FCS-Like Zinc finger 10 n=1 Tax=Euphorbia lathyris TaxID=212925 RepID=UPI0033140A64
MAYSASESYFQSDALPPRHISSIFFNIPGFFVGFGSRGSSDSESIRSPTSPLDFGFFSNLSNPFSHKPPKSPTQNGHQSKWDCSKVGLGIINLLVDETKSTDVVLSSPKRKNIIFGSQVKTGYSMRSNSFPSDYMLVLLSQTEAPNTNAGSSVSDAVFGTGVPFETESFQNSSSVSLSPKSPFSSKKFCSEHRTTTVSSLSLLSDGGQQTASSLDIKLSSLPVPISTSQGHVGSLSAREIELSEDYTCIISYGPNPKTTHIFGDCILECHTNELSNFTKTENMESELSREADSPDSSTPYPSDEFLSFCYSCKKKLEEGDDIYIYRGEKAFCSFDCRSDEIFAEDETEETYNKSSTVSSYHEDLFTTGMPIDM